MESCEEAIVRDNGSVKIRYYYGKTVIIPRAVMEKYGIRCWESAQDRLERTVRRARPQKEGVEHDGRV